MREKLICIAPSRSVQKLLRDFLNNDLASPGRGDELRKIKMHLAACGACQDACLEYIHRILTIPFMKELAKQRGISFKALCAEIRRAAETQPVNGNFRHKQKRRP